MLAKSGGMAWGVWQIPEAELRVLGDVRDRDILEFGCGAAQWSIALAQAGARPVGLDLSERQLEHARTLMARAGVDFPLVHASAEAVPLPDASFDIVFCDHGAMTFADPRTGRCPRPRGWSVRRPVRRSTMRHRSSRSRGRPTPSARATGSSSTTGMHEFDTALPSTSTCRTANGSGCSRANASSSRI